MNEHARYFAREAYTSMPWRNGAGVTREIARAPAQGESFAWRLSLASLPVSGPFSSYSGYQRCVALVDGHGFRLNVAGAAAKKLSARGEYALFPGAAEASCELLDGPCTDLSLIVHDPGTIDSVTRLDLSAEQRVRVPLGKLQVLFVLQGTVACCALEPFSRDASSGYPHKLNLNDTLLILGRGAFWSIRSGSGEIGALLLITFTPS
jgi:hypothetical protein